MNKRTPYNLAKLAFEHKELDKLLLGKDPYKYMTKFFSGSDDSDVGTLIDDGILPYVIDHKGKEIIDYLNNTLYELCLQYDGLPSLAYFMICCAIYIKNKGVLPVDINFEKILEAMRKSISQYADRLKSDVTGEGWRNKEGKYGDLKRLSKITTEKGGLNFFPEENQQQKDIKI